MIYKALQKQPQNRYHAVLDFNADLKSLQDIILGKPRPLIAMKKEFQETPRGIYAPLIGRDAEIALLENRLRKAQNNERQVVFLSGEAGIGKSRLAWEFGQRAKQSGTRYLMYRCLFDDRSVASQPFFSIIRDYFILKGVANREQLVGYIDGNAPGLSLRNKIINNILFPSEQKSSISRDQEQLYDTVTEIIKLMARDQPLVIHLDDIQWADMLTLRMLRYLISNTYRERLCVVCTYRPEDIQNNYRKSAQFIENIIPDIDKEGTFTHIPLSRLNQHGTSSIVKAVFKNADIPEAFTASLHQETEGNPLFIVEILKALMDEKLVSKDNGSWRITSDIVKLKLPGRLADVIARRLRRLSHRERQVIDVASVEGHKFQSESICHCLNMPRLQVLRILQNLESSHYLIHAMEHEYQFDHGKIQEAIYENLIPELREEYHRRCARYYIANHPDDDKYASTIVRHLLRANKSQDALPYFAPAAQFAQRHFSLIEACDYCNRAVKLLHEGSCPYPSEERHAKKLEILKLRMHIDSTLGNNKQAMDDAKRIMKIAENISKTEDKLWALGGMGNLWRKDGRLRISNRFHSKALKLARAKGFPDYEGYNLMSIGINYWLMGDLKTSMAYLKPALRISRRLGDKENLARVLYNIGTVCMFAAEYKDSLKYLKQELKLNKEIGNEYQFPFTWGQIGWCHLFKLDHNNALKYFNKAIDALKNSGEKHNLAYSQMGAATVHRFRGEYKTALSIYKPLLSEARKRNEMKLVADFGMSEGILHEEMGDFRSALSMLGEIRRLAQKLGLLRIPAVCLFHLGKVQCMRGAYKQAYTYLKQSALISKKCNLRDIEWYAQIRLCRLWRDLGEQTRAIKALHEALCLAKRINTKQIRVSAVFDKALYELLKGRCKGFSMSKLHRGLKTLKRWNTIGEIVYGLFVTTEMAMAQGNVKTAQKYADRVLRLATEKGRKPDQTTAHILLARIALEKGDFALALEHGQKAVFLARECGMSEALWQAFGLIGRAYMKQREYQKAYANFRKAGAIVNRLSKKLKPEWKAKYLRKKEARDLFFNIRSLEKRGE